MQGEVAVSLSLLRRAGAKTRKGTPCRSAAMPSGRCRMQGGASTGRALLKALSASGQLARSMGDIAKPPSLSDVRRAPSSGLSGCFCEVTPRRSKKWNKRWMCSGENPDEQASSYR